MRLFVSAQLRLRRSSASEPNLAERRSLLLEEENAKLRQQLARLSSVTSGDVDLRSGSSSVRCSCSSSDSQRLQEGDAKLSEQGLSSVIAGHERECAT